MKENDFLDGISHIESDVVERFVSVDNKIKNKANKSKVKAAWLRLGAIAACFVLILSAVIVVPMLLKDDQEIVIPSDETSNSDGTDMDSEVIIPPESRPDIPIVNVQNQSNAPRYYGSESSGGMSSGAASDVSPEGISVVAQLVETLPDTYTFFDDWHQYEYRPLKMKTVKLLRGQEMSEEFYYLVPVAFVTDFSIFDSFVIKDMAQFGYDYSVMYNKTQGKAEQFDLAVFGYRIYGYHLMGVEFMAFDSNGNFDGRLWNANEAWIDGTDPSMKVDNIEQAEYNIQHEYDNWEGWKNNLYVHLLKDISGEAKEILDQVKSFENGIFVPQFSSGILHLYPEVQFYAKRYINGFATNEQISIYSKEWTSGDQDTYAHTKARFNEEDMARLPDLSSAFESVKVALDSGLITPPHFNDQEKLRRTTSGIFGWYAKTENGVIGVVRVTWSFLTEKYQDHYDDAYYVIEYGSDVCKAIDRDDLLELLGDYESTYIYTGRYSEYGKGTGIILPTI